MGFYKDCAHYSGDFGGICRVHNVSGFETGIKILRLVITATVCDTSFVIYKEGSESLKGLNRKPQLSLSLTPQTY